MNEEVIIKGPPTKKQKTDDKGNDKLNSRIPQRPFYAMIVGPRHSGKSFLTHHLLSKEKGMYGDFFFKENIILYSPTYEFDKTFHDLKLEHTYSNVEKTPVTWIVQDVIDQQAKERDQNNMAPVLITLDDITQIKDAWKALERLGYIGRHFAIDILAIAHKMSSIPRGVRTQVQQWILFKPHEQSEWDWILDMFARKQTKEIWMRALKRVWAEPYQFIYIDFERKGYEEIYRHGFNQPLFTKEEERIMEGEDDGLIYREYKKGKKKEEPEQEDHFT